MSDKKKKMINNKSKGEENVEIKGLFKTAQDHTGNVNPNYACGQVNIAGEAVRRKYKEYNENKGQKNVYKEINKSASHYSFQSSSYFEINNLLEEVFFERNENPKKYEFSFRIFRKLNIKAKGKLSRQMKSIFTI